MNDNILILIWAGGIAKKSGDWTFSYANRGVHEGGVWARGWSGAAACLNQFGGFSESILNWEKNILQCIDESIFLTTSIQAQLHLFLMPLLTSLVSSPGFMNLRSILTLRCALPVWKTQIPQHVEWLHSGSICSAMARPHYISDWLVDLLLVWLSESYGDPARHWNAISPVWVM